MWSYYKDVIKDSFTFCYVGGSWKIKVCFLPSEPNQRCDQELRNRERSNTNFPVIRNELEFCVTNTWNPEKWSPDESPLWLKKDIINHPQTLWYWARESETNKWSTGRIPLWYGITLLQMSVLLPQRRFLHSRVKALFLSELRMLFHIRIWSKILELSWALLLVSLLHFNKETSSLCFIISSIMKASSPEVNTDCATEDLSILPLWQNR